jgi:hypothetical protein
LWDESIIDSFNQWHLNLNTQTIIKK